MAIRLIVMFLFYSYPSIKDMPDEYELMKIWEHSLQGQTAMKIFSDLPTQANYKAKKLKI